MVFEEELKSVAPIVLGVLLVFEEVILVVIDAGVYIGRRFLLLEGFHR